MAWTVRRVDLPTTLGGEGPDLEPQLSSQPWLPASNIAKLHFHFFPSVITHHASIFRKWDGLDCAPGLPARWVLFVCKTYQRWGEVSTTLRDFLIPRQLFRSREVLRLNNKALLRRRHLTLILYSFFQKR